LKGVEIREHSQVKISNRFAALENFDDDDDDDDDGGGGGNVDIRFGEVLEYESFSHRELRLF
jgi:hypothetical protein